MEMNIIYYLGLPLILLVAFIVYIRYAKRESLQIKKPTKQNFEGKFQRRNYDFHNGLVGYQEQLNLEQSEELACLLAEIDLDVNTELTLDAISTGLFRKKGLRKFLEIVLITEDEDKVSRIADLKQDEIEVIFTDFFTLNPKMKLYFEILKVAVASQTKTGMNNTDTESKKEA